MKRQAAHLSESLSHRLNAYALAASAAGVSVLALAQSGEAKIVYTKAHVVLHSRSNSHYLLDLNHDGIKDFNLRHAYTASTTNDPYNNSSMEAVPFKDASNGFVGKVVITEDVASALYAGVKVGPSNNFVYFGVMGRAEGNSQRTNTLFAYYWANSGKGVRNRYLGLRFAIKGKLHYGWARVTVSKYRFTETLTGFAYETVANKSIVTGKTKGPDVITVHDPSLGHLARGASAIPVWRQGK